MNVIRDVFLSWWYTLANKQWELNNLRRSWNSNPYNKLSARIDYRAMSPFYAVHSRRRYVEIWGKLLNVLERDEIAPEFHYRHFTKPKDDGSRRKLAEPDALLKNIQHSIRRSYLKRATIHPAAVGFRKKKSTADHAWAHAGAHTIVTADIIDFFPNTRAHRVESWWSTQFPDQPDTTRLYTLLTTYKGGLPQGAPTSPDLSNIVNYEMDVALERRAKISGGLYTRYCDDLAFSWRGRDAMPSDFEAGIRSALGEYGYHLHRWRAWDAADEPNVTGIILKRRGGVALPDDIRATMRQLARSGDPADTARLKGYRAYESMVLEHQKPP